MPEPLPRGWEESTLGASGQWLSGGTPSKGRDDYWSGTIPWVSPKDMKRFRLDDVADHISDEAAARGSCVVPQGSVFIVVRGMILAHTFPVCLAERTMAFNQDVKAIVPDGSIHGEFLAHWLNGNSDALLRLVTEATHGTKRIDLGELQAHTLLRPPVIEQIQIAAFLNTLDETIRKTEQIIAKLQQVKQGLLHDLLTSGIDDNGELRQVGSPPWSSKCLADLVVSAVDGPFGSNLKTEHYVAEPGIRLVRLQNIGTGVFLDHEKSWISEAHASSLARHEVRPGDVLVASLGDDNHPFARGCLYPRQLAPGIVKADCFRLRMNDLMEEDFLPLVLNAPHWRMKLLSGLAHRSGVSRDRINLRKLMRLVVPVPSRKEQRLIIDVMSSHEERFEAERAALQKLRLLKQGLMDDLLTGRVRVTPFLEGAAP